MNLLGHDIGVCSWSLGPSDTTDLIAKVQGLGLAHVQLGVADLLVLDAAAREGAVSSLNETGIKVVATMIDFPGEDYSSISSIRRTGGFIPEERWHERENLTLAAASFTRSIGVTRMSTHVGFIPTPNSANYATVIDRIIGLARQLADLGIDLLMELGQESASELLQFLNNLSCKNVGVNFDPANLILYGSGDPIDALKTLGRHVRQVHVKDAIRSVNPGMDWGREVPFGDGEVPPAEFIRVLRAIGYTGPLIIEREAGDDRAGDVRYAIETLGTLS